MQQTRKTTDLFLCLEAWLNCTRELFTSNYVATFDHTFHWTCLASLKDIHAARSALLILTNEVNVDVVVVDLSKAFDSVCRNLLLAKLKAYGLTDSALDTLAA